MIARIFGVISWGLIKVRALPFGGAFSLVLIVGVLYDTGMAKAPEPFEIIRDTDSEIDCIARGKTIEALFDNALRVVASIIKPEAIAPSGIRIPNPIGFIMDRGKKRRERISVEAVDINSLLVSFLSEVLTRATMLNAVFTSLSLQRFGDSFLEGHLAGVAVESFDREIQAVEEGAVDIKKNPETDLYETKLVFSI